MAKAALKHAMQKHNPDTSKPMFHSDQGVQYSARKFVDYLDTGSPEDHAKHGQVQQLLGQCDHRTFFREPEGRTPEPYDTHINHNAVIHVLESHIRFYNYGRLHSAIDYRAPHLRPQQLKRQMKKAA